MFRSRWWLVVWDLLIGGKWGLFWAGRDAWRANRDRDWDDPERRKKYERW